jgi:hypothetical protein
VRPVRFPSEQKSTAAPVRAPDGLRPGSRVFVDVGTGTTLEVFGQTVGATAPLGRM